MPNQTYDFSSGAIPATANGVTWAYNSSPYPGANTGFAADTTGGSNGSFANSLHGPDINDSQFWEVTATFTVDSTGNCSFYSKVSSESGYDYGRFYIDGTQNFLESGTTSFTQHTYSLAAGSHTLKWRYDKDGSASVGLDQWFVSDIVLPNVHLPGPSFTPSAALGTGKAFTAYPSTFVVVNSPEADGVGVAFGARKALYVAPVALGTGLALPPAAPGDSFASPIVLTGSGSRTISLLGSTETGEPAVQSGGDAGTIWLQYVAPSAGTFTITVGDSSYSVYLDEYEVDDTPDLSELTDPLTGTGSPTQLAIGMANGTDYRFRVYATAGHAHVACNVAWTFTARDTSVLQFGVENNVSWTPSEIIIDLGNATPLTDAVFSIDGTPVITLQTDAMGMITAGSVPVPAISSGTHTVSVVCDSVSASADFDVLYGPLPGMGSDTGDANPTTPPTTAVQYWVLEDPAPGGETYTFPRNPESMTPLFAPRVLTVESTTAFDGQSLTWEANKKGSQFSFSGTLTDKAQLDAFERFANLNRRIFLVDHNKEAWYITIEKLDATPLLKVNEPWAHKYTVTCNCFFGPVQL